MTAAAIQLGSRPAGLVPAGSRAAWFALDEAARLMDVAAKTLLNQCPDLAERGMARRLPLAIGGRPAWHVHASVSPRLVRAGAEATETGESAVHQRLRQATQAQRDDAARKARLLIAFRAWRSRLQGSVRANYAAFRAAHKGAPSLRSIEIWSDRCPTSDDLAGCMASLLDTRGRPPEGAPSMSEAAWDVYVALRTGHDPANPNSAAWSQAKVWRVVRHAAIERGWAWPSQDTVVRTEKARLTPSQLAMARLGEDRWAKIHAAPIEQDPEAWAAGECWEGDNSRLDFFARDLVGGEWTAIRPWITAWIDRRSRRLMGWQIGAKADSTSIRHALLSALETPGASVPEHVWIDNGKDFAAASLAGLTKAQRRKRSREDREADDAQDSALFTALGIRAHFAQPYNHNGKARVERFFSTMHQDFDREQASWCGSDEGDRPDAKAHRAVVADVMGLPTLDEVRERFTAWAEWYNARSEHAIQDLVVSAGGVPERLSPAEFYQRHLPALRVASKDSLRLLWPVWSRALKVSKRGVGLTIAGKTWRFGAGHPALDAMVSTDQQVYVAFDPKVMDEVDVYDTSFRHLCRARLNQLLGGANVSKADMQDAMSVRREQRRRAKERPSLVELALTDTELAARKARERQVAETNARLRAQGVLAEHEAPSLRLVQTPVDGQAARVERARKAAGAEHDELPGGDAGEEYGDLLMVLAGGPSNGCSTGVGSRSEADPDGGESAEFDLLAIDLGMPDEDDGGDILATLGVAQ